MLHTEMRNPKTMGLDKMSAREIVQAMHEENLWAVQSMEPVLDAVARAIDVIADAFAKGGRLFYLGAGTSGRLAVVDAAECPPTFGVERGKVVGILAGGLMTMVNASENIEDDPDDGIRELKERDLCGHDVVVGISASGGATYVLRALEYASGLGCPTIGISSNPGSKLDKTADIGISADTGPEVLTGSTRLKAGTVQKLALNMLSTGAMVRSGYVYENMMINLKPTNIKLRDRVVRIVTEITDLPYEEAEKLLEENGWIIRDAIRAWKK